MLKTTIVNFYGGPGCGKSTMAAAVFAELKWAGVNCELVTEYAKTKVWEESFRVFESQMFVSANQIYNIATVAKHVDLIITDSPILLGTAYSDGDTLLNELIKKEYAKYNNINIFLSRVKKYVGIGRIQTEEQAIEKDKEIRQILLDTQEPFYNLDGAKTSVEGIVMMLLNRREYETEERYEY